jgi:hypothetical protein
LVGSWKSITTGSDSGLIFTDTELVTLSSNWYFRRRNGDRDSIPGLSSFTTADSITGTWSSTATEIILSDSAGTDTVSYTLSGSHLTVAVKDKGVLDTLKFTKQ